MYFSTKQVRAFYALGIISNSIGAQSTHYMPYTRSATVALEGPILMTRIAGLEFAGGKLVSLCASKAILHTLIEPIPTFVNSL